MTPLKPATWSHPQTMTKETARRCIGVFDSGFGGLTVLRSLRQKLPGADYLYLGDTARLPYGSKSAETVTRYTAAAVRVLAERGAEVVVIACNTASALALPNLAGRFKVPLVGVIQPGAAAAAYATKAQSVGPVLVLATEATVASHAYAAACAVHGLAAFEKACPLLVPLVEEGWTSHDVTRQVTQIYLQEALQQMRAEHGQNAMPSAILLGCTHYPLLRSLLEQEAARLMPGIPLVDSADATAEHVLRLAPCGIDETGNLAFLATDSTEKFARLGARFLGEAIIHVERIDLDR